MPSTPSRTTPAMAQIPSAHNARHFIDTLPRTVNVPTACTVVPLPDGRWRATIQLTAPDQAALEAAAPPPAELCCAAQHALALAAYSSQIDPANCALDVHHAEGRTLHLDGAATLWFAANAPVATLQALLAMVWTRVATAGSQS
jgi:hypothetical protein